ncbi:hypothetical protein D3C85_1707750 [compost metagenome]
MTTRKHEELLFTFMDGSEFMNFERKQDVRAQTERTLRHINVLHDDLVRPSIRKGDQGLFRFRFAFFRRRILRELC